MFLNQGAAPASTGPSLPWINVMICHGADSPAGSTITTNFALGPGCMASFFAMMMAWFREDSMQGAKMEVYLPQSFYTSQPLQRGWSEKVGPVWLGGSVGMGEEGKYDMLGGGDSCLWATLMSWVTLLCNEDFRHEWGASDMKRGSLMWWRNLWREGGLWCKINFKVIECNIPGSGFLLMSNI